MGSDSGLYYFLPHGEGVTLADLRTRWACLENFQVPMSGNEGLETGGQRQRQGEFIKRYTSKGEEKKV